MGRAVTVGRVAVAGADRAAVGAASANMEGAMGAETRVAAMVRAVGRAAAVEKRDLAAIAAAPVRMGAPAGTVVAVSEPVVAAEATAAEASDSGQSAPRRSSTEGSRAPSVWCTRACANRVSASRRCLCS